MNRPRTWLIAALIGISIITAATPAGAVAGPGPEHARLTAMTGTWDVEMTFSPGDTPSST